MAQKGLNAIADGTGISEPLSRHVNLLGTLLGQVIAEQYGEDKLELIESLRQRCKRAVQQNDASLRTEVEREIRELDLDTIDILLKAYTDFFHLINKAEQQEIIPDQPGSGDHEYKREPENRIDRRGGPYPP